MSFFFFFFLPLGLLKSNGLECVTWTHLRYIHTHTYMSWVQVTPNVTLNNVTPPNNLLMNLYFDNSTVGLHILFILKMHANFHTYWMLFIIWFINSFFMYYFKLQKLEFIQLKDGMTINLWSLWNFASMENI